MTAAPAPEPLRPLTRGELELLEFARTHWRYAGARDTAIRERFQLSPTRYHQRLQRVIDHPEATAYDAQLVNRLLRLRTRRTTARRLPHRTTI